MGNEPSVDKAPIDHYRILYRLELVPGDVVFPPMESDLPPIDTDDVDDNVDTSPENLSVELLLTCEHGQIGPIPCSQLQSNQARTIESWHADVGNPKYLIVVTYRTPGRRTPSWTIHKCVVTTQREIETVTTTYRHRDTFTSGSGVVYSVTMSPSNTEVETTRNHVHTFKSHRSVSKEKHQA